MAPTVADCEAILKVANEVNVPSTPHPIHALASFTNFSIKKLKHKYNNETSLVII